MSDGKDYQDLVGAAERAVHDLLTAVQPDEFIGLRTGYRELRREASRHNETRMRSTQVAAVERVRGKREEIASRWSRLKAERRETLLLHALGDDRLLIRELTERINRELVPEDVPWRAVYEGTIRGLVARLLKSGQLDRIAEPWRGKVRYRYYVRRGLNGPIADLDRAFYDEDLSVD